MDAHTRDILKEMGFIPVEQGSMIYRWLNWEFDFSNRQTVDALAACIWDVAQHYGERKREKEIIFNIIR